MNKSNAHLALERLVDRLTELDLPYAIVGALSLNAYGYQRTTSAVDVLLRREDLESFKRVWRRQRKAHRLSRSGHRSRAW